MKMFVNLARLDIGQLFTQSTRWGHPCTLDIFLVDWIFIKRAGNEDRDKIVDEVDIEPDQYIFFQVTHP